MSETDAKATVTEQVETTETTPVPSNPMLDATVATITPHVNAANELAAKIAAQGSDNTKSLLHEILFDNETTDATIIAFRNWHEQANAAINAKVTETEAYATKLLPAKDDNFDENKAKAEYKLVKDQYNAAVKFLKTMPDFDESWLTVLPTLKTLRGGNTSAGGTSGGRRPRVQSVYVGNIDGTNMQRIHELVGEGDKQRDVSNFTLAAKFIGNKDHANCKVEPKQLHEATFAAAGTDDLNSLNGKPVEFSFSPDEGKHTYMVRVVPNADSADETESTEEVTPAEVSSATE